MNKLLLLFFSLVLSCMSVRAQLKVRTSGSVCVGDTTDMSASYLLKVGENLSYNTYFNFGVSSNITPQAMMKNIGVLGSMTVPFLMSETNMGVCGVFTSKRHIGLSAQELQQIYPNLVEEGQDGYLSVNYVELIPIMIRCVQELKEELDEYRGVATPLSKF